MSVRYIRKRFRYGLPARLEMYNRKPKYTKLTTTLRKERKKNTQKLKILPGAPCTSPRVLLSHGKEAALAASIVEARRSTLRGGERE